MVTIVVAAILASAALPSMQSGWHNAQLVLVSDDLLSAFYLARSEALNRQQPVSINATDGANWTNGWVVWVDGDGNGAFTAAEAVRYWDSLSGSREIVANNGTLSFTYQPTGILQIGDVMQICDPTRQQPDGRQITILISGALRAADRVCS